MGGYLMDHFIERERAKCLVNICVAFRPSLSVSFLEEMMKFSAQMNCTKYLRECGAVFASDDSIDTKQSLPGFESRLAEFKKIDIKGQL